MDGSKPLDQFSAYLCLDNHLKEWPAAFLALLSGSRKRGVEFKGGSLHDGFGGFDGFGGSGEHLTLRSLIQQISAQ